MIADNAMSIPLILNDMIQNSIPNPVKITKSPASSCGISISPVSVCYVTYKKLWFIIMCNLV